MPHHTILIIDYEPRSIATTAALLKSAGYEVGVAHDGVAGLKAFYDLKPALVLIEAMLPKKHGFEVCQEIKKSAHGKRTPVLIMTAVYRGRKYRTQALHIHGCDEYLEKPIQDEKLLELCGKFLKGVDEAAQAKAGGPATAKSVPEAKPAEAQARAVVNAAAYAPAASPSTPPSGSPTPVFDEAAETEIMARLDAILPSDDEVGGTQEPSGPTDATEATDNTGVVDDSPPETSGSLVDELPVPEPTENAAGKVEEQDGSGGQAGRTSPRVLPFDAMRARRGSQEEDREPTEDAKDEAISGETDGDDRSEPGIAEAETPDTEIESADLLLEDDEEDDDEPATDESAVAEQAEPEQAEVAVAAPPAELLAQTHPRRSNAKLWAGLIVLLVVGLASFGVFMMLGGGASEEPAAEPTPTASPPPVLAPERAPSDGGAPSSASGIVESGPPERASTTLERRAPPEAPPANRVEAGAPRRASPAPTPEAAIRGSRPQETSQPTTPPVTPPPIQKRDAEPEATASAIDAEDLPSASEPAPAQAAPVESPVEPTTSESPTAPVEETGLSEDRALDEDPPVERPDPATTETPTPDSDVIIGEPIPMEPSVADSVPPARAAPADSTPDPKPAEAASTPTPEPEPEPLPVRTLPGALVNIDTVDTPPVAISRSLPAYTSRARYLRQEGTIVLNLLISEEGRVEEVSLLSGIQGSDLNDRAVDAAKRWKYEPAIKDGVAVKVWKQERLVFKL